MSFRLLLLDLRAYRILEIHFYLSASSLCIFDLLLFTEIYKTGDRAPVCTSYHVLISRNTTKFKDESNFLRRRVQDTYSQSIQTVYVIHLEKTRLRELSYLQKRIEE
jgi:hypothetical protein